MGKFLDKFKDKANSTNERLANYVDKRKNNPRYSGKIRRQKQGMGDLVGVDEEDFLDEDDENGNENEDNYRDDYRDDFYDDDVGVQPAQKPESFHHFILENQYKDLERSIRGLKDIWNKEEQKWITKRKEQHCFTDEEAEDILRTAQSHLATDVKLGFIRMESFGDYMDAVYKEIAFLFESIAEYRYGRYGDFEKQYKMKLQNQKIFLELFTRIQMNYSRAIAGSENKATHGSVRGQESLQSGERDYTGQRGYS
jgi:hypothetical protein